jgi:hypothetical protein
MRRVSLHFKQYGSLFFISSYIRVLGLDDAGVYHCSMMDAHQLTFNTFDTLTRARVNVSSNTNLYDAAGMLLLRNPRTLPQTS